MQDLAGAPDLPPVGDAHHPALRAPLRRLDAGPREFTVDPENMLAESLLDGVQINVDGWMTRPRSAFSASSIG